MTAHSQPLARFEPAPLPIRDAGHAVADFDAFYRREFPSMVALAHTICGDRQLAEDLAQDALTRAHGRWSTVGGYEKPGAWLRRVTINLALSRRRRLAREVVGLGRFRREPVASGADGATSDPDREVWDAVATLAPRQRAAIALFYQEDLSTTEIAEILGCTISTATSHLSQARKRLAVLLGEPLPEVAGRSRHDIDLDSSPRSADGARNSGSGVFRPSAADGGDRHDVGGGR